MRRWLGGTVLLLAGMLAVCGAEKDSEEAAKTREERLKVKISVEFKNTMLEDALKEVLSKIDDAGKGKIELKFNTGISHNQKITYSGKDKSTEDVLDGMLGDNLGYVIISKKGDKTDGGLLIVAGNARGDDKGGKMAAKTNPKEKDADKGKTKDKAIAKDTPEKKESPKTEKKEAPKTEAPAGGDAEKDASSKLELIRMLIDSGKKDKAKERLGELVEKYPDTKAAKEAKELLEKLK